MALDLLHTECVMNMRLFFINASQVVASKTTNAKLESEVNQERANHVDLQKVLCDERKLMSTMDMEHQSHLVELEQRHQEKVDRQGRTSLFTDWTHFYRPF